MGVGLKASACSAACTLHLLLQIFLSVTSAYGEASMHMVFSTECNNYFDWQTLGMVHSWKKVGQKGQLTRLMACDVEDWPGTVIAQGKNIHTHKHPNWAVHPTTRDGYPAYNKPASIIHWLANVEVKEEFIIVLDADMILRNPFTVELVGAKKGRPVAAHYGYLVGIFPQNKMTVKAKVNNPHLAQQVGGFVVMHREDLRQVAPEWLRFTEEVRQDAGNWANTGDIFNGNGKRGPPWISEMYGYVYACAHVGVVHEVSNKVMLYPGYMPAHPDPWPLVLHYGITYNIDDYAFDKHWHRSFQVTNCPSSLFEKPFTKEEIRDPPGSVEHRRKEVALDAAWGLHEASVEWRKQHCKQDAFAVPEYTRFACTTAANGVNNCRRKTAAELAQPLEPVTDGCPPTDDNQACCSWAQHGECTNNPSFMFSSCKHACGQCYTKEPPSCVPSQTPPVPVPPPKPTTTQGSKSSSTGLLRGVPADSKTAKNAASVVDGEANTVEAEAHEGKLEEPVETSGEGTSDGQDSHNHEAENQDTGEVDSEATTTSIGSVRVHTGMFFPLWGVAVLGFLMVVRGSKNSTRAKTRASALRGGATALERSGSGPTTNKAIAESRVNALSRLEALEKATAKGR